MKSKFLVQCFFPPHIIMVNKNKTKQMFKSKCSKPQQRVPHFNPSSVSGRKYSYQISSLSPVFFRSNSVVVENEHHLSIFSCVHLLHTSLVNPFIPEISLIILLTI